jgi:hypothetical protein
MNVFSKASESSWAATTLDNLNAGEVGILWIAKDNAAAADGETNEVTGVTDSAGNTWAKAKEYCNANGAGGAGATVSLWWTKADATLAAGGTVTVTLSGATTAKAALGQAFTIDAANTIEVLGSATEAQDAADPGNLSISGLDSGTYLYVRAVALEDSAAGGGETPTTGYTALDLVGTSGGGAATNMQAWGEFRIVAGTGDSSDPTVKAVDSASVYVAFGEVLV